MKRKHAYLLLIAGIVFISLPAAAEESTPDFGGKLFSYETDADDAVQSLDRISGRSGRVDRGFAPAGNTYKSENHYKPGPFGQQDAMSSDESENST